MKLLRKLIWSSRQRKTYNELTSMTDKELNDIGLGRCEILRIVNEMEGN
jgi:uncharacterized protein YjiS (DUF1127 family)